MVIHYSRLQVIQGARVGRFDNGGNWEFPSVKSINELAGYSVETQLRSEKRSFGSQWGPAFATFSAQAQSLSI